MEQALGAWGLHLVPPPVASVNEFSFPCCFPAWPPPSCPHPVTTAVSSAFGRGLGASAGGSVTGTYALWRLAPMVVAILALGWQYHSVPGGWPAFAES